MEKVEFDAMLSALIAGERNEIEVEKIDFFTFRQAWLALSERHKVVGEAGLNGKVIYRFIDDCQEK